MCGILGIIRNDGQPLSLTSAQMLMLRDLMQRRGPDDAGMRQINPSAMLAHRRLAIRDPAQGAQPWVSDDQRWTVTYNGELYNVPELEQLSTPALKAAPHTRCDTEALMRMLQGFGKQAVSHFRGMFAFGAYDATEQRLLLARDRFGIKPLYFAFLNQELVFASSLAVFSKHPQFTAQLNPLAITHYLMTLRPTLGTQTLWQGVYLLPPGHLLEFDANGIRIERYWSYPTESSQHTEPDSLFSLNDTLAELDTHLSDAVRCRLISDVPVGMMLSGGVDSCLLGSYLQQELGANFVAECGQGGTEQISDDAAHAEAAARLFDCRFRSVHVSAESYQDGWRELITETGQPLTTPSDVIIYRLSQSLKSQVGVVLGGEGADELFCGYGDVHGLALPPLTDTSTEPLSQLQALLQRYLSRATLISGTGLQRLWRSPEAANWEQAVPEMYRQKICAYPASDLTRPQQRLQVFKRMLHEVNLEALLMRLDQASMAASLEARVPFTDHRLIEAFWNLPAEWTLSPLENSTADHPRETKRILRALAARKLPEKLAQRPKASFPTPVPEWLNREWHNWAREKLTHNPLLHDLFQTETLLALAEQPQQSGMMTWPLLNLALWAEA